MCLFQWCNPDNNREGHGKILKHMTIIEVKNIIFEQGKTGKGFESRSS